MPEKFGSGAPGDTTHIDPIAFDDQTIFGLDPAVHWVHLNNQNEQFPEIVGQIVIHWNDRDWLLKLLHRLGYTGGVYHPKRNPRGIFDVAPNKVAIFPIRFFLLRAAGVRSELLRSMFGLSRNQDRVTWRLVKVNLQHVIAVRARLAASMKNKGQKT